MSNIVLEKTHPLVSRSNNTIIEEKIVSFHSEDRDIKSWPNSNQFAIDLPEEISEIQSMNVISGAFPKNLYVFSRSYQNTKLNFSVDFNGDIQTYTAEISEGRYNPEDLAREIENKMNLEVIKGNNGVVNINTYDNFKCKYNDVTNTLWFGNNGNFHGNDTGKFSLNFDIKLEYTDCKNKIVWNQSTKWGLPWYLGYEKKKYVSLETPENLYLSVTPAKGDSYGFSHELEEPTNGASNGYWLQSTTTKNWFVDISESPCKLNIDGEMFIYMEVDKYNKIDEIEPYSDNTKALYNNDYNGKVNSAFAKLPIFYDNHINLIGGRSEQLVNGALFKSPIKRLKKIKFKFRYHDGRLVDFKCQPITFSIQFNVIQHI
tara:strand:+ start:122 stop:1240 length:1119 start_codon:yes stop_codon:yes gene_type:complete